MCEASKQRLFWIFVDIHDLFQGLRQQLLFVLAEHGSTAIRGSPEQEILTVRGKPVRCACKAVGMAIDQGAK